MPDIVSIGECFIEFFTYEMLHSEAEWELVHSGDTYNVLAMANRLGTSCGYITRISDDPFGDYLLEEWRKRGIDTTHARQVRAFNAVEFSSSEPVGEGSKVVYRKGAAASTMTPDDIDPAYIANANILHVSGISQGISRSCRETVMKAVKIAHESEVLVSYDTNLRVNLWESIAEARDAMDELLPYIDIITPSFPHEPAALIDLHSEREVIDWFLERGVGTVGLKCGAEGAWVGTHREIVRIPGVAPRGLLHTSGAGDTFVGGLLHCIANGMDAVEGARWGVASAGLKAGGPSIEAQPSLQEVLEVLPSVQAINVSR
ncbi:MAG: sugar kinase [Chloroflexota bacterium]|nr:sugar kinase [Chloroflexota bacterium]